MAAAAGSTSSSSNGSSTTSGARLLSVDFEVFGKVQGVFFRKNTKAEADKLGLVGWVMNTERDTVVGNITGSPAKISLMKTWLETKGSPKSKISRCDFKNEKSLSKTNIKSFTVKK